MNISFDRILELADKAGMGVDFKDKTISDSNNYTYYDMTEDVVNLVELVIREITQTTNEAKT